MFKFRWFKPKSVDEIELRKWMEDAYGGLLEHRSTSSYALEFLKTERANTLMALRRSDPVGDVENHG